MMYVGYVNNIKMDLKDTEWDDVDWINPALDRIYLRDLVKAVPNLRTE
jgi:hypothetical protein